MSNEFRERPKPLKRNDEIFLGYTVSDVIPAVASMILYPFFGWLILIVALVVFVVSKEIRIRKPKNFYKHLFYHWGLIKLSSEKPKGKKTERLYYE